MTQWSMRLLKEEGLLCVLVEGEQPESAIEEMIRVAVGAQEEHGVSKYLIDARRWTPSWGVATIYQFPKVFKTLGLALTSRIAILHPGDGPGAQLLRFFDTVCFNAGYTLRVFGSPDAAARWLGLRDGSLQAMDTGWQRPDVRGAREEP